MAKKFSMNMKNKIENPSSDKEPLIHYVLMRNDIDSLNAGKACAHANHACSAMMFTIMDEGTAKEKKMLEDWRTRIVNGKKVRGKAGICIVKACSDERMKVSVSEAKKLGIPCGIWTDDEFPSTTSRGFCLIDMDVSAWFLGTKTQLWNIIGDIDLMP